MTTTLVLGASGATGQLLVNQLLEKGHHVKALVRPSSSIPGHWNKYENLQVIKANISETSVEMMASYLEGCHAAASCLGHNMTFRGIYGKPRKLLTEAVQLLCKAIELGAPERPVKIVLMNTAGNRNRDQKEPVSFGQKIIIGLIRALLPPHLDNEQAADHLRVNVGQSHPHLEWCVVRPDTLIDEAIVTDYSLHASPTRSAIFNPGKTSRINVGNLMAELITDEQAWHQWKGCMPVVYNTENDHLLSRKDADTLVLSGGSSF